MGREVVLELEASARRLCAVTEVLESLATKGLVEVFTDSKGERRYRITQAGIEYQERLRSEDEPDDAA